MEPETHSSKRLEKTKYCAAPPATTANANCVELDHQLRPPLPPLFTSIFTCPDIATTRPATTVNDVALEIGQAYDGIHRIQAILAYIKIMNGNTPGLSSILDEARHTYDQALRLYEERDFEGSLEYASASWELFQALEIVISRVLRSDSFYPTLVLLPPEHDVTFDESIRVQEELHRVEGVISLIRRVAETGSSLSEDQKQTLNIASCSERLLKRGRQRFRFAEMEEAIDLVNAAAATAHAAEHVCKRWYVMQAIDPFLPPQRNDLVRDESSEDESESDGHAHTVDSKGRAIKGSGDPEHKTRG